MAAALFRRRPAPHCYSRTTHTTLAIALFCASEVRGKEHRRRASLLPPHTRSGRWGRSQAPAGVRACRRCWRTEKTTALCSPGIFAAAVASDERECDGRDVLAVVEIALCSPENGEDRRMEACSAAAWRTLEEKEDEDPWLLLCFDVGLLHIVTHGLLTLLSPLLCSVRRKSEGKSIVVELRYCRRTHDQEDGEDRKLPPESVHAVAAGVQRRRPPFAHRESSRRLLRRTSVNVMAGMFLPLSRLLSVRRKTEKTGGWRLDVSKNVQNNISDTNDASENETLQGINELELNNSKSGGTHVTSAQNEDEANLNQEDEISPIQEIGVNLNQDEVSMEYKKEKEKRVGRRSSHRLAEQARQEMLKARKAAHGGHEVGDTSTDPLVLTSEDEEMETPPPAMERVPENQQNDADYVLFLLKQSENEGPRNISSPNSSAPTQESSYSPSGYAPTPPRAKSKASKGTASSSRKK
nr:uncharacterized protein LOC109166971 [Ipomoea trifida]